VLKVTAQLLGSPVAMNAVTNAPPARRAPAANPSPVVANVEELDPEEQRSFATARAELNAGNPAQAREIAAPLFAKYPALSAIQSLRCDTAMAVGGDWDIISVECPGQSPFGRNK
jgi:hypothetical protein